MLGEGMPDLRVDQIGQRCPVGFVADVPGLQPSQLGVGRAGAGLRHLGQAQVDRVGQDRGQQQILVLGQVAVSGVYRRSVMLASGRFAMLDDGKGFSLVPWKAVIEQRLGSTLAATVRAGHVTWEIGRQRGPTVS